jgi:beta-lactamase superfamily II metal-dependent hydrolase
MIDFGRWNACSNITGFVASLGITHIDYAFATHYDADHIGCLDNLDDAGVTIGQCVDRGGAGDTQTYEDYAATCAGKRATASKGQVISLGQSGGRAVSITVVDLNGAGANTSEENALSLVLKLTYGAFDHEFGGDLTGESPDIESIVAPKVGEVEVYKVHHHGSAGSNNDNWLNATSPLVGIISVGNNPYGHPTSATLARLHAHSVHTYWTNAGSGAAPDASWDAVGGTITIAAYPGDGATFMVSGTGVSDSYVSQWKEERTAR